MRRASVKPMLVSNGVTSCMCTSRSFISWMRILLLGPAALHDSLGFDHNVGRFWAGVDRNSLESFSKSVGELIAQAILQSGDAGNLTAGAITHFNGHSDTHAFDAWYIE